MSVTISYKGAQIASMNASGSKVIKVKQKYCEDDITVHNVEASASLQSKSVSVTENGTVTVSPDAGYDGLSSVSVNTNVQGGVAPVAVATISNGTWSLYGLSSATVVGHKYLLVGTGTFAYGSHVAVMMLRLYNDGYMYSDQGTRPTPYSYSRMAHDGLMSAPELTVSSWLIDEIGGTVDTNITRLALYDMDEL